MLKVYSTVKVEKKGREHTYTIHPDVNIGRLHDRMLYDKSKITSMRLRSIRSAQSKIHSQFRETLYIIKNIFPQDVANIIFEYLFDPGSYKRHSLQRIGFEYNIQRPHI